MKKILILFSAALLSGCTSVENIYNNEKYEDVIFNNRTIMICPSMDIKVRNTSDVLDDYPEDSRDVRIIIKEKFYNEFLEETKKFLHNIKLKEIDNFPDLTKTKDGNSDFKHCLIQVGERPLDYSFYVPKKEVLLKNNITPDIMVVINNLIFDRSKTLGFTTLNTMQGSTILPTKEEHLKAEFDFAIWDYKNEEFITYGVRAIDILLYKELDTSTWKMLYRKITREIFNYSMLDWEYRAVKHSDK